MAEKKPIANYDGQLKELQSGDTIAGADNGVITKSKSGDESVTSSTTVQNDDHLIVPLGANETWLIQFDLFIIVGASTNFKWKLVVPSGASASGQIKHGNANAVSEITDATSENTLTMGVFASSQGHVTIFAKVTTSSTAGNVQLQWAQGTSSGTALTVKSRSKMLAIRE